MGCACHARRNSQSVPACCARMMSVKRVLCLREGRVRVPARRPWRGREGVVGFMAQYTSFLARPVEDERLTRRRDPSLGVIQHFCSSYLRNFATKSKICSRAHRMCTLQHFFPGHVCLLRLPLLLLLWHWVARQVGGERPELDPSWPKEFHGLLKDCWNGDPSLRPDMTEVRRLCVVCLCVFKLVSFVIPADEKWGRSTNMLQFQPSKSFAIVCACSVFFVFQEVGSRRISVFVRPTRTRLQPSADYSSRPKTQV